MEPRGRTVIFDARPPVLGEKDWIARFKEGAMFAKCCNPECEQLFDYREGRLVRFSRPPSNGPPSENQKLIEHFWLCGKCDGLYVFDCESEMNVKIKLREPELLEEKFLRAVAA